MAYIQGIDVSSVQGKINWELVAASGVEFCIVKCYQGNSGIDPNFSSNIAEATAAGLKTACYHFVYPLPPEAGNPSRDPVAQAQAHFAASEGQIAVSDFEWPIQSDWAKWGCSASQINDWGLAYLEEYARLGAPRSPIVYTYPYFAQSIGFTAEYAQYPLWIASYEPTPTIPSPWNNWLIWQTTGGGGKLPNGEPVDTDVVRDLSMWDV